MRKHLPHQPSFVFCCLTFCSAPKSDIVSFAFCFISFELRITFSDAMLLREYDENRETNHYHVLNDSDFYMF